MVPPPQTLNLDITAISGICGYVTSHVRHIKYQILTESRSISIACWVVVFSPQIIENFRRSSADGLSLQFIIVWLAGDVFNILGAVLQGVLPTMVPRLLSQQILCTKFHLDHSRRLLYNCRYRSSWPMLLLPRLHLARRSHPSQAFPAVIQHRRSQ